MADVGLADTLANRERAKMELYRAKADALLNVAERWPMIDRKRNSLVATSLPEEERASLVFPADIAAKADSDDSSADTNARAQPELDHSIREDAEKVARPVAPTSDDEVADAAPPEVLPIETPSAERPEPHAALAGRVLRLDAFEASYEVRNNRDNWTPATASDVRMLVRTFRDILKENDVAHSGEIGQQHVAALRQHLEPHSNALRTELAAAHHEARSAPCLCGR